MAREQDENEFAGPGVDLAISLCGILLIVVVITVIKLWITSLSSGQPAVSAGQLQNAEARAAAAEAEANDQRSLAVSANSELRKLRILLALAEQQAAAADAQIDSLKTAIAKANAETDETRKRVEAAHTENLSLKRELANAEQQAAAAGAEVESLRKTIAKANAEAEVANGEAALAREQAGEELERRQVAERRLNDKPPLITISDAAFRTFKEGSAEISPELSAFLADVVGRLQALRSQYGANVIEVIGHTDEVKLGPNKRVCNLDENLIDVLNGRKAPTELGPCDNVGLGMARAIAVVVELRRRGLGDDFVLLPLSAGAAIDTDDSLAKGGQPPMPIPARRRIDIRLRRGE